MDNQNVLSNDLLSIYRKFIGIMKDTEGVMGAWNFGSVMHGGADKLSDVDVVFLIDADCFAKMEERCTNALKGCCDELLLCWGEEFNSDVIINNGYLLKLGSDVFQFDVFLLNSAHLDDYMYKIHYSELSAKDIVFDRDNAVKSLCEKNLAGQLWSADIDRLIRTYLYHFNMTAKYLLRVDYFKLNGVVRTLFDTHASLLLTVHDKITWGGMENKLHFIPKEKQEHLKRYYCTDDFLLNKDNLQTSLEWFEQDLKEVSEIKSVDFDNTVFDALKAHWHRLTKNIL